VPELLTAKDVEMKVFKKVSFGGYSIPEVEEFLNQIAEDLEAYVLCLNEQQRKLHELEEALKRYESMKDTIKDALILAQQSARGKEEEARREAEFIVAQAEDKADEIVATARTAAARVINSAEEMKEEALKRLDGVELEISRYMEEANEKANNITTAARLEAVSVTDKAKHEIEECKREMDAVIQERRRFLRDSEELVSAYTHMIEEAAEKLYMNYVEGRDPSKRELDKPDAGKIILPLSSGEDSSPDDEAAIS